MGRTMKTILKELSLRLFLLLLWGLRLEQAEAQTMSSLGASPSASAPLAIIVNKKNPIDGVSFAELRAIFLAEQGHWSDGHSITLVMRDPAQPEREAVLRQIYHMEESDLNRHFLQLTFTGAVQTVPKMLSTTVGVRKFVFNVPSAIGYVKLTDVDDSVKVLHVDGHLPGESGYPLVLPPQ